MSAANAEAIHAVETVSIAAALGDAVRKAIEDRKKAEQFALNAAAEASACALHAAKVATEVAQVYAREVASFAWDRDPNEMERDWAKVKDASATAATAAANAANAANKYTEAFHAVAAAEKRLEVAVACREITAALEALD